MAAFLSLAAQANSLSPNERQQQVYRDTDAPAAHKETAHYQTWRDTVADMMAEPRTSTKYVNVHPDDAGF